MADARPHSLTARVLLCLCIILATVLVGVVIYLVRDQRPTVRGSGGAVLQSAPGRDPAPLFMRPH